MADLIQSNTSFVNGSAKAISLKQPSTSICVSEMPFEEELYLHTCEMSSWFHISLETRMIVMVSHSQHNGHEVFHNNF